MNRSAKRTTWEDVMWTPEQIWRGRRVFVMASGPSLTEAVAARVQNFGGANSATIVVNSSYMMAPWADCLFFTDNSWFEPRRAIIEAWPRLVVSVSRAAKRAMPNKVLRVQLVDRTEEGMPLRAFPPLGSPHIRFGRSSGQTAIALAIAMGAKEVVLLGFDMRVVNGMEHHHGEYFGKKRDLDIYAREFVPAFAGWNIQALRAGVKIINATPDSGLREFMSVPLDVLLPIP